MTTQISSPTGGSVAYSTIQKPLKEPLQLLTEGIKANKLETVQEALDRGADPNGMFDGEEAIHLACEKGNLAIVRALLDRGADPNLETWEWRDTPLHRACLCGHVAIVKELLDRGAIVNIRNQNCRQTPLEYAIFSQEVECCRLLIENGALVNEFNPYGKSTPLTDACHKGNYSIVLLLLDAGANPNLNPGIPPLYEAAVFPEILQLLINRGAEVDSVYQNFRNGDGNQPLHHAANWGNIKSVEILLNAGANPKAMNARGQTPISKARWQLKNHRTKPCNPPEITARQIQNFEEIIGMMSPVRVISEDQPSKSISELLIDGIKTKELAEVKSALQKGADPNRIYEAGNIFHFACELGDLGIVRELLDQGASLDGKSWKMADTPLHRACIFGNSGIVKELLLRGADVTVKNHDGQTPLDMAISFQSVECCRLLIEVEADVNQVKANKSTPLANACGKGNFDIVFLLLRAGADPNLNAGTPSLYTAANSPKIVQLLLQYGAKVDCKVTHDLDIFMGDEPLHHAAGWGCVKSVRLLLNAGADPRAVNDRKKTPLDRAKAHLRTHRIQPCNPPDITSQIIEDLNKVIEMLSKI